MILTPKITARLVAIVLGGVLLQLTFFSQVELFHVSPDVLPALVVSLGLLGGTMTGAVTGFAVGFLLGWCISLILVFIVNPQSFHWTMQLHMPWGMLAAVAAALLASAALTALLAGRQAVSGDAVRAVREDW